MTNGFQLLENNEATEIDGRCKSYNNNIFGSSLLVSFSASVYNSIIILQKYVSINFIGHLKCSGDSFKSCYYDELPKPYSSLVCADTSIL